MSIQDFQPVQSYTTQDIDKTIDMVMKHMGDLELSANERSVLKGSLAKFMPKIQNLVNKAVTSASEGAGEQTDVDQLTNEFIAEFSKIMDSMMADSEQLLSLDPEYQGGTHLHDDHDIHGTPNHISRPETGERKRKRAISGDSHHSPRNKHNS